MKMALTDEQKDKIVDKGRCLIIPSQLSYKKDKSSVINKKNE